MELHDKLGQTTALEFSKRRAQSAAGRVAVQLHVPPGADVIGDAALRDAASVRMLPLYVIHACGSR